MRYQDAFAFEAADEPETFDPGRATGVPLGGNGFQNRDFHGFFQAREWVNGEPGRWCFDVTSFTGLGQGADEAQLLMWDGTTTSVPISGKNAILVRGHWYDRRHWTH